VDVVLREIIGAKREEVTGINNEKLHNLCSLQNAMM
jgi:hypothetical protein